MTTLAKLLHLPPKQPCIVAGPGCAGLTRPDRCGVHQCRPCIAWQTNTVRATGHINLDLSRAA